jgi:hypothetical protein
MKLMLGLALSLLVARAAVGEDMDLRNRAEQSMSRALVASRLTTPMNIRTDVNALREDFVLGDYRMSRIQENGNVATHGQWVDIPYTLRKVMEFVPYLPIRFDSSDVITRIHETKINGKRCCLSERRVRLDQGAGDQKR